MREKEGYEEGVQNRKLEIRGHGSATYGDKLP